MVEQRTGPGSIDSEEVQRICDILYHGRVVNGSFSQRGIFEIASTDDPEKVRLMWSEDLLRSHPERAALELTETGDLLVKDSGGLPRTISPGQVRIVDTAEPGIVSKSGFVLPDHAYVLEDGRSFSPYRLEEILVNAEKDIKPPIYTPRPFVKVVDPQILLGYTLFVITFETPPDNLNMRQDAVVIRKSLQSLVPRIVVWPLSQSS
ncbi:MAG: hypothetical protein Q8Q91_03095 [Candidatus Daviesbacteria bacterium]|nr:hypothetical protein [Candidatus Daviesbacteria bacterium]